VRIGKIVRRAALGRRHTPGSCNHGDPASLNYKVRSKEPAAMMRLGRPQPAPPAARFER